MHRLREEEQLAQGHLEVAGGRLSSLSAYTSRFLVSALSPSAGSPRTGSWGTAKAGISLSCGSSQLGAQSTWQSRNALAVTLWAPLPPCTVTHSSISLKTEERKPSAPSGWRDGVGRYVWRLLRASIPQDPDLGKVLRQINQNAEKTQAFNILDHICKWVLLIHKLTFIKITNKQTKKRN